MTRPASSGPVAVSGDLVTVQRVGALVELQDRVNSDMPPPSMRP
jgi:hypothetical protein